VAALGGNLLLALGLHGAGVHIGLAVGVMVIDALLLGSLMPLIWPRHLGRGDFGLRGTRPGTAAVLAIAALVLSRIGRSVDVGGPAARQPHPDVLEAAEHQHSPGNDRGDPGLLRLGGLCPGV
jgi:hypothetical protein